MACTRKFSQRLPCASAEFPPPLRDGQLRVPDALYRVKSGIPTERNPRFDEFEFGFPAYDAKQFSPLPWSV